MIFLALKSVPELAPLSPQERLRVHRACHSRYKENEGLKWLRPLGATILCVWIVMVLLEQLERHYRPRPFQLDSDAVLIIYLLFWFAVVIWVPFMLALILYRHLSHAQLRHYYAQYLMEEETKLKEK